MNTAACAPSAPTTSNGSVAVHRSTWYSGIRWVTTRMTHARNNRAGGVSVRAVPPEQPGVHDGVPLDPLRQEPERQRKPRVRKDIGILGQDQGIIQ